MIDHLMTRVTKIANKHLLVLFCLNVIPILLYSFLLFEVPFSGVIFKAGIISLVCFMFLIVLQDFRINLIGNLHLVVSFALLTLLFVLGNIPDLDFNYLYLYFIFSLIVYLSNRYIDRFDLLKLTNVFYVFYTFISFLVYFKVIEFSGKNLNIFNYSFLGMDFKTFIGYYGSTATIDSLSFFVAILNLLIFKDKRNWYIISLSLLIGLGTLRSTPIIALILTIVVVFIVKRTSKKTIPFFNLIILISFLIPSLLLTLYNSPFLYEFFNKATSSRSVIWDQMLSVYWSSDFYGKLFGYGNTHPFTVTPFGYYDPVEGQQMIEVTNPHNNYFTILIQYGIFILGAIYYLLNKSISKIKSTPDLFIVYFILFVGIVNNEIFNYHFPIYSIWIIFILFGDHIFKGSRRTTIL